MVISEPQHEAEAPSRRPARFTDEIVRPVVMVSVVVLTTVDLFTHAFVFPVLTVALFVPVGLCTLAGLLPWPRCPQWLLVTALCVYMGSAALLFPLAPITSAPAYAFIAAMIAGERLASRRTAQTIAFAGALVCAVGIWLAGHTALGPDEWSAWLALSTALPVYMGMAARDRHQALLYAERATESEAREAALLERARIAREIHDVLGHSLSSIAIQLDMADALHASGRDDDANTATRQARALAVGSITETRRAIHALREDTLPLTETLKLMAGSEKVSFDVTGEPSPVTVEAGQTAVRVAQEALTNAAKYAPGAARSMTLDFSGDTVSLTITNAPGTAPTRPDAAGSTGMGLVGMRERAALLGGTLHAGPAGDSPGHSGWTVELEIPK